MTFELDISTFHPDRPGIRKVLGDLEAEIMELIWMRSTDQGTTVRDVFAILYERRGLAYTSIMNTMTRLAKKNLLRVEKKDTAYIYYPNYTQQEFVSQFVSRILEDLFVSFSTPTCEAIHALPDAQTATYACQLLEKIQLARKEEEE